MVLVSDDPEVQAKYEAMLASGESHNMAEMLAVRKFPGTRTDREFQMGRCNGNQFETCPLRGDWYRREAEAANVSTTGKFYHDGLASYPGDPAAWVSDRGDVLRVAREKGFKLSGLVDYDPGDCGYEPAPDVKIDPSLVASEVEDILEENPGANRADVEEKVYELRTGRVDPHPLLVSDHNPDDHMVDFT